MTNQRKLKFGLALTTGSNHREVWRHPRSPRHFALDLDYYKQAAAKAEAGKVDFIFVADGLYIDAKSNPDLLRRFEPLTLLTAIAGATSRIGLVATASTTYSEPYNVARQFASLDHISGGRAGWNIVTTAEQGTAANFGRESHMEHDLRYRLAEEFLEVAKGLWDSWEDDAFALDKQSGRYFHPDKLHALNHQGEFFSVQGPLNISRSRQGRPVLVQAGSSEAGLAFAAKTADVIFTQHHSIRDAKEFYKHVKGLAVSYGRSPDDILILPGTTVIAGETEEAAEQAYREVSELIQIDEALKGLQRLFDHADLSRYPLDEPFVAIEELTVDGYRSTADKWRKVVREENLTLRQLAQRAATPRERMFIGTPQRIADSMQEWFENEAADGFIIAPGPIVPDGIEQFVDLVLPILRQRGLVREEYEADTLHGHLGLPIPANRYAASYISK
ncbi:LLM class flavin-dependent oxidoreductase [Paenibacillus filicis]|uniref:LLM class flavin-dependent oxidoreductase n=1 Tax=Paenibacillus filicis TaxID=669464 RepID=A0ABU9DD13_9BACL